jgi:hypothetical protein
MGLAMLSHRMPFARIERVFPYLRSLYWRPGSLSSKTAHQLACGETTVVEQTVCSRGENLLKIEGSVDPF